MMLQSCMLIMIVLFDGLAKAEGRPTGLGELINQLRLHPICSSTAEGKEAFEFLRLQAKKYKSNFWGRSGFIDYRPNFAEGPGFNPRTNQIQIYGTTLRSENELLRILLHETKHAIDLHNGVLKSWEHYASDVRFFEALAFEFEGKGMGLPYTKEELISLTGNYPSTLRKGENIAFRKTSSPCGGKGVCLETPLELLLLLQIAWEGTEMIVDIGDAIALKEKDETTWEKIARGAELGRQYGAGAHNGVNSHGIAARIVDMAHRPLEAATDEINTVLLAASIDRLQKRDPGQKPWYRWGGWINPINSLFPSLYP